MENRVKILRTMKICRFCLSDDESVLGNIYERQDTKLTVPLPLQLMACVAIEVFENDGMPQSICNSCRYETQQAYEFKTNCKKADDALKVYLSSGILAKPLSTNSRAGEQKKTYQSVKRSIEKKPSEEETPKKHKPEIITLNYSNLPETSQAHDLEESDPIQTSPIAFDENDAINPTLKVNQVQTDCFSCQHCERSFPLKQLLELHMNQHNRERNFTCNECDKSFFNKYDLTKHIMTHSESKPFSCVVCQKSFAREILLHRHEKIHSDAPKYLCTQCDRTFLNGDDLDAHMAKHKKKRPFSCGVCQKSFVFKQGLDRHEQSHNTIRPHKCNYCEASFTSAIKLTRHVTSHAGLRPYPCKLCGRTFLLSHHLTRHMRSHYAAQNSPETAFIPAVSQHKCDICSMSFRRKDSLINHSAIHSMVNLKCVICNTEFDEVGKVKEHITTHLADLPFPCEMCDYSFDSQEQLEDHELKHAEMEYEEQIEQEVLEEARQQVISLAQGPEDSDYSGDEIAEFTITNDIDNPEVVRRSKRTTKIKNYAEFLKDELGSDLEETGEEVGDTTEEFTITDELQQEINTSFHHHQQQQVIKPIVRLEGTKVYGGRKNSGNENKTEAVTPLTQGIQSRTLETISKDINKIPDKSVFNMKIGDKMVTVQKLLLTKEQMKAMAKEGKIEKKGNTLLLKKNSTIDSIFTSTPLKTPAPPIIKTYQKSETITLNDQFALPIDETTL